MGAVAGGPLLEDDFGVGLGVAGRPAVDFGEMGQGGGLPSPFRRQAEMLDFVACGAEGDEPDEALDVSGVVVVPDLVAFDGVASASAAADLAAVPRRRGGRAAEPLPDGRGDVAAHVRPPAGRGHQFHRESRHRPMVPSDRVPETNARASPEDPVSSASAVYRVL